MRGYEGKEAPAHEMWSYGVNRVAMYAEVSITIRQRNAIV